MKTPLFEIKDVDRRFYAEKLEKFLPKQIIDIHTHVWRQSDFRKGAARDSAEKIVSWPGRVAQDSPIEELLETYRLMMPGKQVTPLIFPTTPQAGNIAPQNRYAAQCVRRHHVPGLVWSDPKWDAKELER